MLPTAALLVLAASAAARDNSSCDAFCGRQFRQTAEGSSRIVGGQTATHRAWPWMVSLQFFTYHDNRRYHACGGTLLNSQWLLTAAHCFREKKQVYEWRLIFGARDIEFGSNKPVKPPLQERHVEKIIIHERYHPGLETNDIALLKITPPVLCGRFVGPGCLPQFSAGPPSIPQTCWVIGWGFLRETDVQPTPVLQEARVNLLDLDLCNSSQWYNGRIFSTNLCAGYPEGKIDTCQRSHRPNTAPEDGAQALAPRPASSCARASAPLPSARKTLTSRAPHTQPTAGPPQTSQPPECVAAGSHVTADSGQGWWLTESDSRVALGRGTVAGLSCAKTTWRTPTWSWESPAGG
ncbi:acrosin isoform X1 [Pteropus medius]|uniref:acrosin isoform X1 n=1 Tax=Pteropus vampyrus TaxID=132908 RepID=UPI00196A8A6E|nr:acrosin isoform X1 [Pteropus giganteus]